MEFTATESGFEGGLGGASNAAASAEQHYVLFGMQTIPGSPKLCGTYFEFDDQIHGDVNCVASVEVAHRSVEFRLRDLRTIVVRCGTDERQWQTFLYGVREVFGTLVRSSD